jgi:hypothetical protein
MCKGTARGGGRRGVQADSARLVSGRRDVSGGVADANERADGGGALRRGARGDGGGDGGTDHRGGVDPPRPRPPLTPAPRPLDVAAHPQFQ